MGICDRLDLSYLGDEGRCAKGKASITPKVQDRIAVKLARERSASSFRAEVWKRDKNTCRLCGRAVKRSLDSTVRGHVHHLRGRNVAPADKFNPAKALLVCAICHAKIHQGTLKP